MVLTVYRNTYTNVRLIKAWFINNQCACHQLHVDTGELKELTISPLSTNISDYLKFQNASKGEYRIHYFPLEMIFSDIL